MSERLHSLRAEGLEAAVGLLTPGEALAVAEDLDAQRLKLGDLLGCRHRLALDAGRHALQTVFEVEAGGDHLVQHVGAGQLDAYETCGLRNLEAGSCRACHGCRPGGIRTRRPGCHEDASHQGGHRDKRNASSCASHSPLLLLATCG
ncbi:hypothetical protein ACGFIY_16740 [Micromonospora chersina]|uniref:hypothetical protein n=1 Tax=Micromonospora chersina TaxID=47854 RepID=UPI00371A6D5D